jgi:hypothetical protein
VIKTAKQEIICCRCRKVAELHQGNIPFIASVYQISDTKKDREFINEMANMVLTNKESVQLEITKDMLIVKNFYCSNQCRDQDSAEHKLKEKP